MDNIEKKGEFSSRFSRWNGSETLAGYPFVKNVYAPLTPLKRALPMLNLALITSAGAYIDGTEAFDLSSKDGDLEFREFPVEINASDLRYSAKGYDPKSVTEDRNAQIPIDRLREFEENGVIGRLNEVWFSLSSYIPNAARVADELAPKLAERLHRYNVQAAALIPASRLCHQTMGILARGIEAAGIPTILVSVDRAVTTDVRPPRTVYYDGEFGSVAGTAGFPEYQRRIMDESLRLMETFDQPGDRKLIVDLQSKVEAARGER